MRATWLALALLVGLTVPAFGLELQNIRSTYGPYGTERKSTKLVPHDQLVVSYDISDLKVVENRVKYSLGFELLKDGKKSMFKRDPQTLEADFQFGGNKMQGVAFTEIGADTAPGKYSLRVTVNDLQTKPPKSKELSYEFEVVAPKLSFVKTRVLYPNGTDAPSVGVPGQALVLRTLLVGFDIDKKGNPDIALEYDILEEGGKSTLAKPYTGSAKTAPEKVNWAKMNNRVMELTPFFLTLSRPGKYKVALKATDNQTKQSVTQQVDVTVLDPRTLGR